MTPFARFIRLVSFHKHPSFVKAEINQFFGKAACEKGIMRSEEKVIGKTFSCYKLRVKKSVYIERMSGRYVAYFSKRNLSFYLK